MVKKLWIFFIFFVMSLFVWISFANPIYEPSHYCKKLKNLEIDNYKVVIETDDEITDKWWIYTPNPDECIRNISNDIAFYWTTRMRVLLLDKSFDIWDITREDVDNNAIFVWDIWVEDCYSTFDCTETAIYDIVRKKGNYKLIIDKNSYETRWMVDYRTKQFPKMWLFAILIETLNLFVAVKIFRKEDNISNKKLLLFWILPTTITLPILRFILSSSINSLHNIFVLEMLVMLVESVMIKYWLNMLWKKAISVSVIWNFCSFVIPLFFWFVRQL